MANLVAIAYDDVDQAQQVTQTLGELMKEHSIELEDVVIVENRAGGKIKLHQPSLAGIGAAGLLPFPARAQPRPVRCHRTASSSFSSGWGLRRRREGEAPALEFA